MRALLGAIGVPEFFRRVSTPSEYLTDFFGIQVLNAVSPEDVICDLVPALGRSLINRSPVRRRRSASRRAS